MQGSDSTAFGVLKELFSRALKESGSPLESPRVCIGGVMSLGGEDLWGLSCVVLCHDLYPIRGPAVRPGEHRDWHLQKIFGVPLNPTKGYARERCSAYFWASLGR